MARTKQTARKSAGGPVERTQDDATSSSSEEDAADAADTSQPSLPGFKVTVAWPPSSPGDQQVPLSLTTALQEPIIKLLAEGFTELDLRGQFTELDNTPFFQTQYKEGATHVIVTDVPISLDNIYKGTIDDHLCAVAMIDTKGYGDIAFQATRERRRKRGFGKACVYAAMTHFDQQGKEELKLFSKPNTIGFWNGQCGFKETGEPETHGATAAAETVPPAESTAAAAATGDGSNSDQSSAMDSGSGSGSGSGDDAAAETVPPAESTAAAAAATGDGSNSGQSSAMRPRKSNRMMEGKVSVVLEKLKGKKLVGYAYLVKPRENLIIPVEIPRRLVLKREEPESAAAAAAESAGGSVVKKPRKEPKNRRLHEDMLAANSGVAGADGQPAASANPIVAASPAPTPTAGSEAHGQGDGMVGGQPTTCTNPHSFDQCLQNPTGKHKTKTWRKTYYHHVLLSAKDDRVRKDYLRANKQSNPEQTFDVERKHVVRAKKLEADADAGDRVTSFAGQPLMCPNCWQHLITPMLD